MTHRDMYSNMKVLFNPDAIAVIGASDNPEKLGFHVMKSLTHGNYKGPIIPVNPKSKEIMGIPCYPSIMEVQQAIDLGVIVLPAEGVPTVFEQCLKKGVKGIVLISANFKESGESVGAERHASLAKMACEAGVPVIGPNTIGITNYHNNLNASFFPEFSWVERGHVALVSQSGGVAIVLAIDAMRYNVGVSKVIPLGNRLNVDFAEMVDFLLEDPDTKTIALHIEGLDEPRRLVESVKASQGKKPIVVYKAGNTGKGDQASFSHTGSMAGRLEIYEGVMKQAGVLCTSGTQNLIDAANVLSKCPLPRGPRVAIITAQAGPAIVASHVCEEEGLEIPSFSANTQTIINRYLTSMAMRVNPVDLGPNGAWYSIPALNDILTAIMNDENVDAIILLMVYASANRETIQNMSRLLKEWRQKKPVVTCFFAPPGIWDDPIRLLERTGAIVNFQTPDRAAKAVGFLWQYKKISEQVWGTGQGK